MYGGVAWVFLAVSLSFALLAVNALFPVRREPLNVASFTIGWIPSELPLHVGAAEALATVALALEGGLTAWPGWVALTVVVGSSAGWARLGLDAHRAGRQVGEALSRT
ncbi:MAG: hypothetical protein ACRDWB_14195, partial [Acidimicrobiales bacterium]